MVFDGGDAAGANRGAGHTVQQVATFRRTRDDDAWQLAAWIMDDEDERGWSFCSFAIEQGKPVILRGGT